MDILHQFNPSLKNNKSKSASLKSHQLIRAEDIIETLKLDKEKQDEIGRALESKSNYSNSDIEINDIVYHSERLYKIQFTNFVDPKEDSHLKYSIQSVKNNFDELLKGLEVVNKDYNYKRLREICKVYEWDNLETADPEVLNLFKFSGEKIIISNGKDNELSNSFRVFVGIVMDDEHNKKIKILFFDPHHLAIPSKHNNLPSDVVMQRTFIRCQYRRMHIGELFKLQ